MSRSGYSDDNEDPLALGRWRQAVKRSIEGKRGQVLLRDLVAALDAMPDKRLYPGSFATPEGEFCTLGVLGAKRGTKMDDLGDAEYGCEAEVVAQRFGIAHAMAAEIMYLNDESAVDEYKWVTVEICGPMRQYERGGIYGHDNKHLRSVQVHNTSAPADRWRAMREWAVKNLKTANVAIEPPYSVGSNCVLGVLVDEATKGDAP